MLKILEHTGSSALMSKEVYDNYQKELNLLKKRWLDSFNIEVTSDWSIRFLTSGIPSHLEKGLDESKIPRAFNQRLYDNIVFGYDGETIAFRGTVPCAIAQVYEYLCRPSETREKILERIGKILVSNDYLTKNSRTRWVALDKVLELEFGIETKIQSSIFELLDSVFPDKPIIALVPSAWLHCDPMLLSNEAIVIWAIDKTKALITTTSSDDVVRVDLVELLYSIKRAWACHLK